MEKQLVVAVNTQEECYKVFDVLNGKWSSGDSCKSFKPRSFIDIGLNISTPKEISFSSMPHYNYNSSTYEVITFKEFLQRFAPKEVRKVTHKTSNGFDAILVYEMADGSDSEFCCMLSDDPEYDGSASKAAKKYGFKFGFTGSNEMQHLLVDNCTRIEEEIVYKPQIPQSMKTKEEIYKALQAKWVELVNPKRGDKFKIVRVPKEEDIFSGMINVEEELVGKVFPFSHVSEYHIVLNGANIPYYCIEKVEEPEFKTIDDLWKHCKYLGYNQTEKLMIVPINSNEFLAVNSTGYWGNSGYLEANFIDDFNAGRYLQFESQKDLYKWLEK